MSIKLYKKYSVELQQLYDNYIESYNGIYTNDWISGTISASVWNSIAVNPNNGHMLAVNSTGATGNFAYSDNGGLSWIAINSITAPSTNANINWRKVIFGKNMFVGITYSGTTPSVSRIFYSNNQNPTLQTHFSYINANNNNNWESIEYGNGYFIAVASSGTNRIITSKDAITWKNNNTKDTIALKSISYSQKLKRFIVLPSSGNIGIYSNYNGETWKNITIPTGTWNGITWSPKLNIFVIVGNNGVTATSIDGIIWISTTLSPTLLNLTSIIWSQELEIFVAISNSTASGTKKIITSIDGKNWIYRETGALDSTFTSIIWNRFFGVFTGISSAGTVRVLSSRPLGDNILLSEDNYLPETDDLLYFFNYTKTKLHTIVGTSISIFPIINESKNFNFFFDLSSYSLISGLTLNSSTGEISGIVNSTQDLVTYRIYANSLLETKTLYSDLEVYVSDIETDITGFSYASDNLIKDKNDNSVFLVPDFISGTNITYSSSPDLPIGIILDPVSGIISGSLSSVFDKTSYNIIASNSKGNKTFTINITSYILRLFISVDEIEIIESSSVIDQRLEGLFDYSSGYIAKNSFCSLNYGKTKGLISKNFFFDKDNNFIPDMILGLVTYYRIRKSTNTIYDSFLILEIKGNLVGNTINWNKIFFRDINFLKSNSTIFYNPSTDSTIYKISQPIIANFFQDQLTEIIIS